LRTSRFYAVFVWMKSGFHIFQNVYSGGKASKSDTLNEIISDIHKLRFDPNEPYLISGDHFSMLYIRSLGIFYHSLLDPRTALDKQDWINRQKIYLQTTAYALEVFSRSPRLSTTIVPVGINSVALMNVYATPSDSLYSMLYALDVMQSTSYLENIYPSKQAGRFPLQTQNAAATLLNTYRKDLARHYDTYVNSVVDPQTGLIRKSLLLSGTKDIARRQSAFYDNVILWKTEELAQKLSIIPSNPQHLVELKTRILETYWKKKIGCFIEDQSADAIAGNYYSSDWLIVLPTGFLDTYNPRELPYYLGCVDYIQNKGLDQPFGLKYQENPRSNRLYTIVRVLTPEYGGTGIWSNWGMEYIKLLVLLYNNTGQMAYLAKAKQQLDSYSDKIVEYGCYPEVYDEHGKMFKNFFYKSVCQTGWVVTYEEARNMVNSAIESLPEGTL